MRGIQIAFAQRLSVIFIYGAFAVRSVCVLQATIIIYFVDWRPHTQRVPSSGYDLLSYMERMRFKGQYVVRSKHLLFRRISCLHNSGNVHAALIT